MPTPTDTPPLNWTCHPPHAPHWTCHPHMPPTEHAIPTCPPLNMPPPGAWCSGQRSTFGFGPNLSYSVIPKQKRKIYFYKPIGAATTTTVSSVVTTARPRRTRSRREFILVSCLQHFCLQNFSVRAGLLSWNVWISTCMVKYTRGYSLQSSFCCVVVSCLVRVGCLAWLIWPTSPLAWHGWEVGDKSIQRDLWRVYDFATFFLPIDCTAGDVFFFSFFFLDVTIVARRAGTEAAPLLCQWLFFCRWKFGFFAVFSNLLFCKNKKWTRRSNGVKSGNINVVSPKSSPAYSNSNQ